MNQGSPAATTVDLLAYIPSPPQGVWYVGPFALRAYALFIIVGIIVAITWGDRRWQARGGEPGTVLDISLWAIPFGFVGGRAYHVLTDWQKYFGEGANAIDALKVWQGGLGIWGAVAFGALGAWIGCRVKKVPLPAFGDAVAPGILLAQGIGRLGNYFNQELYGRSTDVPWGLEIYTRLDAAGRIDNLNGISTGQLVDVVHPTFLYELLWNVFFVVVLVLIDRRFRIGHGRLFALYVAGYSFGRFWVELLRADPANEFFGIRINSYTSAIVFTGALIYVLLARKGREDPATLQPGGTHADAGPDAEAPAGSNATVTAGEPVADADDDTSSRDPGHRDSGADPR
ncbi:prolipoprotein diacylglyceryl transferase [Hoyosella sp. G463]|uniref:Phosphatidylglycerol--prolipoprotein diacylglyceryl transferase n=1 Tax=Lolliginicoccus lacisalsi TaxID=2742202 RepID=A0A927JDE7_9ACTN|nr:prolipoprotein diacylglyceryl transferase [Lolliginicoccus lacisalsi]